MPNIKALREAAGYTQESLAQALGTSLSTVRNWERANVGLWGFYWAIKLCRALNCDVEDILRKENGDKID
ncbi:helix-turn-helix transcriptional regulator [Baaleninema simplex]|uniref:helix-turn-helix transcriptional regulator n=1 Tax=Baaleninema simplex TaxID=2862350 RepID=UPI001FDF83E7|nr:helix-turn-helix transcriptional regulator [Baaleninema simplex]